MPTQICYFTLFGTCLKMQPFHQPLFNGYLNSFGILLVSAEDFEIICIPHKVHFFQFRFLQRRTSISIPTVWKLAWECFPLITNPPIKFI